MMFHYLTLPSKLRGNIIVKFSYSKTAQATVISVYFSFCVIVQIDMPGSVWQLHGIADLRSFCRVALPLQGYVVFVHMVQEDS